MTHTPAADTNGNAVITLTVRDAGLDGIAGHADDASTSRQFTVIVNAVNDPLFFFNDTAPTEIYALSLHDALPICGISAGGGESQALTLTATSGNPGLIPN